MTDDLTDDAQNMEKAQELFKQCWERLLHRLDGDIKVPKEVIWLNGPPGAGKGANVGFIKRIRGLTRDITTSSLLSAYEPARSVMENGGLVSDEMVGDALLDAVFNPEKTDGAGVIVDGFPRTGIQVGFIECLYNELKAAYAQNKSTPELRGRFPKPSFKIVVLYVDEATSVSRQVARHAKSMTHNQKVREARAGQLILERETDKSVDKCRLRYSVFRRHYPAVLRLQRSMPFSVIDATGSLEECEAQIAHELRYQSSLDLDERTYEAVTQFPLARDIVATSRKRLVRRLDSHCLGHNETFRQVLGVIWTHVMPQLERCAMSGHSEFETLDELFEKNPAAVDMLVDVLTDRGYSVSHKRRLTHLPLRIDLATGEIYSRRLWWHCFRISFPGGQVRDVKNLQAEMSAKALAGADTPLMTAAHRFDPSSGSDTSSSTPTGYDRIQAAAL